MREAIAFGIGNPDKLCKFVVGVLVWDYSGIKKPTIKQMEAWLVAKKERDEARSLERQWESIRARRNDLLFASDVFLVEDFPITDADKVKWKAYRALLRDLPSTKEDPSEIVFPNDPNYIEPEPEPEE